MFALSLGYEVSGPGEYGEVGQPEKIHLEQAQVGARGHRVLRHDHAVVVSANGLLERHDVVQRLLGDDYSGGVGAGMARQALHGSRRVHQILDAFVGPVYLLELRGRLQGGVQRHAKPDGYEARDPVDLGIRHPQGAAYIANRGLGAQGAERDDLRHVLPAVLVHHIVKDFLASVVLEVHVYVRHLLALEVEEALEDEGVRHGIYVGDAKAIEHEAGRGASSHGEENIPFANEFGDVPHHQEVVGELGMFYDL